MKKTYRVNTSNPTKINEFKRYLGANVIVEQKDLLEPDADEMTIIQYKASQFDEVLVDDTALDIEGENIGVRVRWLLDKLPEMIGKKATFVSMLGIRIQNEVQVFRGEVHGEIVSARGKKIGFLPYFLPHGTERTMGEEIIDKFNARFYAVKNFLEGKPFRKMPVLETWVGKFQ